MIQKAVYPWPTRQCREPLTAQRRHMNGPIEKAWDRIKIDRVSLEPHFPPTLSFKEILERASKNCPSVTVDPKRVHGLPCITGTRIPVHLVLWAVEHHGSVEGALISYPDLTEQQVKDALYFAEIVMGSKSVLTENTPVAR